MAKHFKLRFQILVVFLFAITFSFILTFSFLGDTRFEKNLAIIIVTSQFILSLIILGLAFFMKSKQRESVNHSFYQVIEEILNNYSVGSIIYDLDDIIMWVSPFLETKGFDKFLGSNLSKFIDDFKVSKNFDDQLIEFNGYKFSITFLAETEAIIVRDVSAQWLLDQKYLNERLVLGELEIDNFSQIQVDFGNEITFKINQQVIIALDELRKSFQFFYRQYSNGKFLIITNVDTLNSLRNQKFDFLDQIHLKTEDLQMKIGISIGIASGTADIKELMKVSQEALRQAQSHGGDQAAVIASGNQPEFFGAKSEAVAVVSRVKIRRLCEKLIDHLHDPNINNVIVHGHINSDLDAIGAALGMRALVRLTCNKEVHIANLKWDSTVRRALKLIFKPSELNSIFYSERESIANTDSHTLIIIVDTSSNHLIEQIRSLDKADAKNVYIFDHHRVGEIKIPYQQKNVYIDTAASSASEIVTDLLSFVPKRVVLENSEAQMLLAGIYLDTNQFTKTTSARTFAAAAFLESAGASPNFAIDVLKILPNEKSQLESLLENLQEIKPGFFLSASESVVPDNLIAKASEEILRVSGRKAGFVIARPDESRKMLKLSARSVNTNIQRIVESIGGGGHFSAAAARSSEPLNVFTKNVMQAIVTDRDESNNN